MSEMTKIQVFYFKQNKHELLSAVIPHNLIDKHSEVLVYGKHTHGYQRAPEPTHYNKIKNYILTEKDFILPTALVLAIDKVDIKDCLFNDNGTQILNFSKIKKKAFRIVDGQHRIIAMREALAHKPELANFSFECIILLTSPNKRSDEMDIFYNINSKGKRLKVDLIELAKYNLTILEKSLTAKQTNQHISIQVAYHLNEKIQNQVWLNAIKFGIHDEEVIGVIGVNAFRESIGLVVDAYLRINDNDEFKNLNGEDLIKYSSDAATKIAKFISKAWMDIIREKWPFCFKESQKRLDFDLEQKTIFYNRNYYIQRTMGAKALNNMLGEIVGKNSKGISDNALDQFEKIIQRSNVTTKDWEVGGAFAGYSSESGFTKVAKMIKQEDKPRNISFF